MTDLNSRLRGLYEDWRSSLALTDEDMAHLGPPLLISAPTSYEQSTRKVMVFGQETYGWSWTKSGVARYAGYGDIWSFPDVTTLADFKNEPRAIDALMHGYELFDFSEHQPINRNGPFWRSFHAIATPENAVVWNNVSKCDFPSGTEGSSIFNAGPELQASFFKAQSKLQGQEIEILRPDACLFYTGPFYDDLISSVFAGVKFEAVEGFREREVARVRHDLLPDNAIRTYHPNYLSRSKRTDIVEFVAGAIGRLF